MSVPGLVRLASVTLGVLALLLPGPAARTAGAQSSDCSVLGQNSFVRSAMNDIYYWYREMTDANPALFDSPEAYLEAVRYKVLDRTYSYIAGRAAQDAFYSDSQYVGFGFGVGLTAANEYRVFQVFPDSPASEVGLQRGDRFLEIGGRTVDELLASGELGGAFGPSDVGWSASVKVLSRDGAQRSFSMAKRIITIPTVSQTAVFDVDGRRVGYLHFRNFVQPSRAALDSAFAALQAAGASELVLDLRYNGGGLVSVAQYLASLIGGGGTNGKLLATYAHNDKNAFRNSSLYFDLPSQALSLRGLIVIQTRATASASELIVNSLRPYLRVTTIGDTSYGKPVGQYGLNFCDKVLYPVAFTLRNAQGQADYFDGIPADCAAADDLDHQLADPGEASLSEAIQYLRTGSCSAGSRSLARVFARRGPLPRAVGFQSLLNAY